VNFEPPVKLLKVKKIRTSVTVNYLPPTHVKLGLSFCGHIFLDNILFVFCGEMCIFSSHSTIAFDSREGRKRWVFLCTLLLEYVIHCITTSWYIYPASHWQSGNDDIHNLNNAVGKNSTKLI